MKGGITKIASVSILVGGLNGGNNNGKICRKNGCRTCQLRPKGDVGISYLYGKYKRSARDRKLIFDINIEEFRSITSKCCFYCGCLPSQIAPRKCHYWNQYVYNGIDRRDNKIGYVSENILPCCEWCNRSKIDNTFDDFIKYIERFAANVLNNKVPILNEMKL